MCWNAEVSLNTFLFAMFGAVFGYVNGFNRKLLLFFMLFSFIQFYEYMIWSNLDNKKINRLWSIVAYIIIQLQPIASINILDPSLLKTILYIIYIIPVIISVIIYKHDFKTVIGSNGHLAWNWLESPNDLITKLMWIGWFACFFIPLIVYGMKYKYYFPLVFLASVALFTFYNYFKAGVFGTMWCWVSNAIWLYVIYVSIRKTHF